MLISLIVVGVQEPTCINISLCFVTNNMKILYARVCANEKADMLNFESKKNRGREKRINRMKNR